ncbi:hypothetical protein [Nocardioides sp. J54]|uniref:hypothetical protein n=1 Tax=Nocardioides sp. J54 TaxID=935866 RepID=UPI0012F7171B|nr:hypothetical protein [Nocardioides sp. J54]
MELNAERAAAALANAIGEDFDVEALRVRSVGSGVLWSGSVVDSDEMPLPGGSWLIGPDGRTYPVSSNPGIHDAELAIELLEAAYRDGLASRLDAGKFSERLSQITQRRAAEVKEFVDDVRGGSLRASGPRSLP